MSLWKIRPKISDEKETTLKDWDKITLQLLANRGINDPESIEKFLNPSESAIHNSAGLGEIEKAVSRIEKAIAKKQKIIIYGDFDVDGIVSTTILWEYLFKERKADALPYIPSKIDEGYGLNKEALSQFAKRGINLVITVDCGIRDTELIKEFNRKYFDIIITDHHQVGPKIPKAYAIVHPALPNSSYPFKTISGATVVWKLIHELEKVRQDRNITWVETPGSDLVSISTVCDLMPLIDENRAQVATTLDKLRNSERLGLKSLAMVSGVPQTEIDTYHLGYLLGPRLNASGRLDEAIKGVRLFSTEKQKQADSLASELNELNKTRQNMTEESIKEAESYISEKDILPKILVLVGQSWHEGIVGLVAGRIVEKYHRPTFAFTKSKNHDLIGSARSIEGFNLIEAIESMSDLLVRYGGHTLAAGLTVKGDMLDDFLNRVEEISENIEPSNLVKQLSVDMEIASSDVNYETFEKISLLKPYGYGNPKPVFLLRKLKYISGKVVGAKGEHFKFQVSDDGRVFNCIAFNKGNLIKEFVLGDAIDAIFNITENQFSGNSSLELNVVDIQKSGS